MSERDDGGDDVEMERIFFRVPSEVKGKLKHDLPHGSLSEQLRDYCVKMAYGEDISKRERLERAQERDRETASTLKREIREKRAELDEVQTRIERRQQELSNLTTRDAEFEGMLKMLEETLAEGGRVDPGHGKVQKAASTAGIEPEEVIDRLRERNPSVPDHAFVSRLHSSEEWEGFDITDRDDAADETTADEETRDETGR